MINELRRQLVQLTLAWEIMYGVAPSITSVISEYDAAQLVGMSDAEYSAYMQKEHRTAVSSGHDFIFKDIRYQIKGNRPSGKPGSEITKASKASNYEWNKLIWICYDKGYRPQEAWEWNREDYKAEFELANRISPSDMRKGHKLDISIIDC